MIPDNVIAHNVIVWKEAKNILYSNDICILMIKIS